MKEIESSRRVTLFLEMLHEMSNIDHDDFLTALIFKDMGIEVDEDFDYNYDCARLTKQLWKRDRETRHALHPALVCFKKACELTEEEKTKNGV